MPPLDQLFALEIQFYRRLRLEVVSPDEASALHTSYALQSGYEPLLWGSGSVTLRELDQLAVRSLHSADARDVWAARDSLIELFAL